MDKFVLHEGKYVNPRFSDIIFFRNKQKPSINLRLAD